MFPIQMSKGLSIGLLAAALAVLNACGGGGSPAAPSATAGGSGVVLTGTLLGAPTGASSGVVAFTNTLTLNRPTTLTGATGDRTYFDGKITDDDLAAAAKVVAKK